MTTYVHLRRYGKPSGDETASIQVSGDGEVIAHGQRWNLRTGQPGASFKGFCPALDGRYLRFATRGTTDSRARLEIVHPGGRVITTEPIEIYRDSHFVGPLLVVEDSYKKPPAVIDDTGKLVARLPKTAHNAATFNPRDGRTLWYVEHATIVQYEVGSQTALRRLEAAPGHVFLGIAVASSGHVLTIERTTKNHQSYHSADDRLVVFDPGGNRVRDRPGAGISLAPLGERFVVADHTEKRFVIYDVSLEPVAAVAMFEPDDNGQSTVIGLPSGREWIAVGSRGEWDHYGEPSLAPTGPDASHDKAARKSSTGADGDKPARKSSAGADDDKPARKPSATAKHRAHKPAAKKPAKAAAKKPAGKGAAKKR